MPAPFDEFPPQVAQSVEGLAWLGYLEAEVRRWGHSWVLRTLNAEEELEASLIAAEYQETYGAAKANAWANVAAALISVDGDTDFCPPIGHDGRANLRAKFGFVTQWHWPVGELLFGEFIELLNKQAAALEAVDSLSNRSLRTSLPSQDSSTKAADSEEPTESSFDSTAISSQQMKTLADSEE